MQQVTSSDPAERFLELLRPIEGQLEAYCRRLIWNPQNVEDCLHNALVRAIGAFDRYRDGTNFRAWMFTILTRKAFALNRKQSRIAAREFQIEPEELESLAEGTGLSMETTSTRSVEAWLDCLDQNLVYALRTLTDPERASFLLRVMAGLSYREIAEALQIPVGSVMGYLGRARKKLRAGLSRRHLTRVWEKSL